MPRRVVLRLIVVAVLALTVFNGWFYVLLRFSCFIEHEELPTITEDAVTSALRDVTGTQQDTSDCRRLFSKETSAHNFSMSQDFQANVDEFLSAVKSSVAGAGELEGNSFQMKTEYRFLHYLTSRLGFVHTVCETGMDNNYCVASSEMYNNDGI